MFSFGIEPSTTNTKGAPSSPRFAFQKAAMKSSPVSLASTLLCRWTVGRPGIAPSTTSSMLGCIAAVIETLSPSQLMPSDVHRMWTSSTWLMGVSFRLLDLDPFDGELLTADHLQLRA